jgi:tetratricopeptide (TPR) repeat protein
MKPLYTVTTLVLGIFLLAPSLAQAESAQEAFDRGQALLSKGDFSGAVEALGIAARADATNEQYVKRYTVARRVVDFRKRLDTETDPKQWEAVAKALRSFYLREKIYPEALALAEKMHQKLNTTASAVTLAETQLAMDQNAEAIKTLQSIDQAQTSVASQSLLAIAYMETSKPDDAKLVMDKLAVPSDSAPGAKYIAARAYGKVGDSAKAMSTLVAFFESVPATQLDAMKAQAKSLPEFESIASTPEFAKVLQTESKVKESACSGGADCASCPVGAKCPSGGAEKKPAN